MQKRPTMTPTDKAPQVHPWGERPNPFAMTIGSGRAFVLLVCVFVVCYLLTAATVYLVTKLLSGNEAAGLRIGAIVQDILLFVLPALATALLASRRPAVLLGVTTPPGVVGIMLAIAILFVSVPAMEAVIYWNWHWDWLGPELEAMARRMEDSTAATLRLLMGNGSVMALVVNILIVGVAAGFAEELFFRGGMLRILLAGRINSHLAVWLVAVIFSALHFQPFGLLPRILLGAYFGYLLLWSRSVWLPMFAHMLNNITYVVTAWSEVRREGAVALDKEPELWSVYATVGSAVATAALIWFLFSHFRGDKTELSGCRFGSTGQ